MDYLGDYNKEKLSFSQLIARIILVLLAVAYSIPFYWMIVTSFKDGTQVFSIPPQWIPAPFKTQNYLEIFKAIPFGLYIKNTLVISILSSIGELIACPLAAYSLSRIDWAGKKYIFPLVLATLMLPWTVTMVPTYILWSKLKLVGTIVPLILPHFFGSGFLIFLLRQFFKTIPKELSEAAYIDGTNEWKTYFKIILPQAKPALSTVVVLSFLASWNDYINQLLYLNNQSTWTISIGLQSFLVDKQQRWELLMAASVVVTIPVIILFFFAQKQLIEGITTTGIKD